MDVLSAANDRQRAKGDVVSLAAGQPSAAAPRPVLAAAAEAELGIDPDELTSPWHAAWASLLAFTCGGLLPLVAIALPPVGLRVWACAAAVLVGLVLTGVVSARLGNAPVARAVVRNVGVGALTMVVTYLVGLLFGVTTG
ncbi:MAG TPA: VIT1/CCC1 transporter family protein [Actinophytocola sp.]|nr:VIT1/CCC1 transporter family protein [Actinophytocola sp.]